MLSVLLWPTAAAWSLTEPDKQRKVLAAWPRFPVEWRPDRVSYFLKHGLGLSHSRFVYFWPDRLLEPQWLDRFTFRGPHELDELRKAERPIVFASMHFGPFEVLPYWLRAHGVAVTALVGRPVSQSAFKKWHRSLSAQVDVPLMLGVNEIAHIRQFLTPGRNLYVMCDVDRGKQIDVTFDDYSFRFATGAIRLAAMAGAELIPCLITEKDIWDFEVWFGRSVPQTYLGHHPDLQGAATHLLKEFLPIVSQSPAQSGHRLVSCISASNAERLDVPLPST